MKEIIIRFENQSDDFTYGVEYGRLLEKMERGDNPVCNNGFPIRAENKEVVIRTARYYEYVPVFGTEANGWIEFIGVKKISSDN